MLQAFLYCSVAPSLMNGQLRVGSRQLCVRATGLQCFGKFDQTLGSIRTTVKNDILYLFEHISRNIRIQNRSSRIDNSHIHSLLDSMIKEHGVHCFTNIIIPSEREREITNTATHMRTGEILPYPARRIDKIDCIIIMLFDTGSYSQNIRIKNNILRIKTDFIHQ